MLTKAYETVTGSVAHEPVEKKPVVPDAVRMQLQINWRNSTISKEIYEQISKEIESLENQARMLACSYSQTHNNHHQIIVALVRATELRKTLELWNQ